jgi:hypothetical protein
MATVKRLGKSNKKGVDTLIRLPPTWTVEYPKPVVKQGTN